MCALEWSPRDAADDRQRWQIASSPLSVQTFSPSYSGNHEIHAILLAFKLYISFNTSKLHPCLMFHTIQAKLCFTFNLLINHIKDWIQNIFWNTFIKLYIYNNIRRLYFFLISSILISSKILRSWWWNIESVHSSDRPWIVSTHYNHILLVCKIKYP